MTKLTDNIHVGDIFSEASFYKVTGITANSIEFELNGENVTIGKDYVDKVLQSGDSFTSTEKKNKTELADLFINSSRVALTVAFYKQDKPKTKKLFNQEKADAIQKIQNAKVSEVEGLLSDLIDNPILPYTPGELRVMRGYHFGSKDDLGRITFTDMDATDGHTRLVDPRTIQYVVVGGVKYELKK